MSDMQGTLASAGVQGVFQVGDVRRGGRGGGYKVGGRCGGVVLECFGYLVCWKPFGIKNYSDLKPCCCCRYDLLECGIWCAGCAGDV